MSAGGAGRSASVGQAAARPLGAGRSASVGQAAARPLGAADPRLGLTVRHQRYVPYAHAHYGGNLVDGAYVLGLFGDVATEASIRADGDEGLFASYSDVQFLAPVLAGDVLEATATITRVGRRSREMQFEARVLCRADPARGPSAARVLDEPLIVVTAVGTVVAPPAR